MALKNWQYDAIMREYNQRQFQNRHLQQEHIEEAYTRIPRLAAIDREIARISVQKARYLLNGEGPQLDLRAKIHDLSRERRSLLTENGYSPDFLDMPHTCALCGDTGYIGREKCSCFKKAAIDLLYTQSNLKDILQQENFSHFSFSYYSDQVKNESTGLSALETARQVVHIAEDFIRYFDEDFQNLFLYGDTGVGKTFLSHCISKELMDSAHSVVYFSSFDLFDLLADINFSRKEEPLGEDAIFDCDLLIIDDLGTELTNSFVASQLFLCINERIMRRRSTIISTNLSIENFIERYSERTFSRISSQYTMLKLVGKDIRIQKKLQAVKKREEV